ncbi:MAG: hypothetical protein K2K97_00430 [Muribaculaceae bacterium]|nr:hypothetical protein [Muribaculaceae bacterium]
MEYLTDFFGRFKDQISDYLVSELGIERDETEEYLAEVNDRMIDIDEDITAICKDIIDGKAKDFGAYFEPHSSKDFRQNPDGGGKSNKYNTDYLPVKCWGTSKPSLVRIYAIELTRSCYIIIYGGIKLDLDTNDCPDIDKEGNETVLEEEIRKRVQSVCSFLREKGIIDPEGLEQFMKENDEN